MNVMDDVISNEKIINDVVHHTVGVCAVCRKGHKMGPSGLHLNCDCGGRIFPVHTALEQEERFSERK